MLRVNLAHSKILDYPHFQVSTFQISQELVSWMYTIANDSVQFSAWSQRWTRFIRTQTWCLLCYSPFRSHSIMLFQAVSDFIRMPTANNKKLFIGQATKALRLHFFTAILLFSFISSVLYTFCCCSAANGYDGRRERTEECGKTAIICNLIQ